MIEAFNSAVAGLKGFLTRGFWFGAFLPVALVAAAHLGIAVAEFGKTNAYVADINSFLWKVENAPLTVLALVVLAFALSPLIPLFRGMLVGSLLPKWLHDQLRERRLKIGIQTRRRLQSTLNDVGIMRKYSDEGVRRIQDAYNKSKKDQPNQSDDSAIVAAETAIRAVADALAEGTVPTATVVKASCDKVVEALSRHSPDMTPPNELSARVRAAASKLIGLLPEAEREGAYRLQVEQERQRTGSQQDGVQATRVGDARRAAERYSRTVYNVEFDFLWPRLLLVVPKDDPILDVITEARSQLDFAVLACALSTTLPLFWLPVLAGWGTSIWLFLAVGIGGPVLVWFCYVLVFESQLGFGEVAKTAIDRHRLGVLRMLRQPEPMTRSGERDTWARLRHAEEDHRTCDLIYMPEAPKS